jgi:hypothetical protein
MIEFGSGITIIPLNMFFSQFPFGMLGDSCLHTFNLLFNALALHLTVGRYSDIQGDLHGHSPDWVIQWVVDPQFFHHPAQKKLIDGIPAALPAWMFSNCTMNLSFSFHCFS